MENDILIKTGKSKKNNIAAMKTDMMIKPGNSIEINLAAPKILEEVVHNKIATSTDKA